MNKSVSLKELNQKNKLSFENKNKIDLLKEKNLKLSVIKGIFQKVFAEDIEKRIKNLETDFNKIQNSEQFLDFSNDQIKNLKKYQKLKKYFIPLFENNIIDFKQRFMDLIMNIYFYFRMINKQSEQTPENKLKYMTYHNKLVKEEFIDVRHPNEIYETVYLEIPNLDLDDQAIKHLGFHQENISQSFTKIMLQFISSKFNFPNILEDFPRDLQTNKQEIKFQKSLIFFLKFSIYNQFDKSFYLVLDIEIPRLFQQTQFNRKERDQIIQKVKNEHLQINQSLSVNQIKNINKNSEIQKMVDDHQALKEKKQQNELFTNYKKVFDQNINNFRVIENNCTHDQSQNNFDLKQVKELRSPLIEKILPSKSASIKKLNDKQDNQKILNNKNTASAKIKTKFELSQKNDKNLSKKLLKTNKSSIEILNKLNTKSKNLSFSHFHDLERQITSDDWIKQHVANEFNV